jgi:diphosphoinositol-polyphosphate diphosphatase
MSSTGIVPAREGREFQRYHEDGRRLVVGCMVRRGEEVLMISSSKAPEKYIIPKGGWEQDETLEEAAARETLEEAGVQVCLSRSLGWFDCPKDGEKSNQKGTRLCIFEAKCVKEHDDWAERGERRRVWVGLEDAIAKCRHEYLIPIIKMTYDSPPP